MSPVFRLRAALAALMAFALLVLPASVAQAQITPLVSAYVGQQTPTSNLGYFVLDFNDGGLNPEVYTLGYYYEGTPSTATFLQLAEATLTGPNGFQETGAASNFVTLLGYNGRVRPGAGDDPAVGYWNFWLSANGTDWASSQFGVRDINFSPTLETKPDFSGNPAVYTAPYHGARWVNDFRTETAQAPRTALASAAAPEPATAWLLLPIVAGVLARRRR